MNTGDETNQVIPLLTVGYVLRRFPQISQTFVLNELIALAERGVRTEVFSLFQPEQDLIHPGAGSFIRNQTTEVDYRSIR